jgi:secreted Zn-dependent insulinase-like peptidase
MWGQFFIAPLFSEKFVEREMNAVESEFQLGLSEDESRIWEYIK